jgi:hypothetical protein
MSTEGFTPDGHKGWTQADSDRLHFRKNGPVPIEINGEPMEFPKYEYRPYPAAIYGVWTDDRKRQALRDAAREYGLDLTKPLERDEAEAKVPKWDSRLVANDRERADWLAKGWTDNPDQVEKAHDDYIANVVAVAAAEQKHSDRLMSDKAKEEFHKADQANGEHHLVDLPAGKLDKKRGRPAKGKTEAASAA